VKSETFHKTKKSYLLFAVHTPFVDAETPVDSTRYAVRNYWTRTSANHKSAKQYSRLTVSVFTFKAPAFADGHKLSLGAFARLRKATISFSSHPSVCPSVRPSAWNNSAPTGRIFMKLDLWVFFENLLRKPVSFKSDKNKGHIAWRPTATGTPRIRNTYCFSTATRVTRTRLNVTLYAHCLSRSLWLNIFYSLPLFRNHLLNIYFCNWRCLIPVYISSIMKTWP
jgi:hypothetical protein